MSAVSLEHPDLAARETLEAHETWLARSPWIGAVLIVVGLAAFGLLLFSVETHSLLTAIDMPIDTVLHARATQDPAWLVLMWRALAVLGREAILVAAVLLGLYWLWRRRWRELAMVVVGVGGGEPIFEFLSRFIDRHRPVWPNYIEFLPGPGFPSGHVMSAILFYGLIAYLLLPRLKSRGWRILVFADAALLALVVGFSRIYIGLHWPTDVLAGYSVALAWGAFVYTGIEIIRLFRFEQARKDH
jgi:undecaprenyl-diphosphatase